MITLGTNRSEERVARGAGFGKVILLGEHSVVYGRTALAGAIDRSLTAFVYPAPGPSRFSEDSGCDPRLRDALACALEMFGLPDDGLEVAVRTDLPVAVGLGSSAALSVALVRALAGFTGRELPDAAVCASALEIEKVFHGFPSGIDNTVATFGGLIAFRKGFGFRPVRMGRSLPLVIALTREARRTSATVAKLRERWQEDPVTYEALFDEIEGLVREAEISVAKGDLGTLGSLMNANHAILARLGVSTGEMDEIVAVARGHGALGAKLTGGGGGGAVICLCEDGADRLVAVFRERGWQAFRTWLQADSGATRPGCEREVALGHAISRSGVGGESGRTR